ncbi:hypothetical protein H4582DRAFT_2056950 [Lactarius indigo]|nr:hypothetical protein H4582DRAFT_2056950 [Lactarius indigo]
MYHDDDDDSHAPHIGPAAMPSPRSKLAPYFLGYADTFEDFLEEFEGLAYDCELTDPQRVDTLVLYVDPSLHELCRNLDGSRSHNWPQFRQSLINVFGSITPRHQIMRRKLRSYIQGSSRTRMYCEGDVLQYYWDFLCYGGPLVHTGHMSEEERDAAFWCGFHPEDREALLPRLFGKNPFQPNDVPFHFKVVYGCARAAFAYGDLLPPWLYANRMGHSNIRREHVSRDTRDLQEAMRAVASNTERTASPNEPPPPSNSLGPLGVLTA